MDMEELNEVATLLHITSEIATNHPHMDGIKRACLRRLAEINAEKVVEEQKLVDASKAEDAKRAAAAYKPPKEGDPGYVAPEKPLEVQKTVQPSDNQTNKPALGRPTSPGDLNPPPSQPGPEVERRV